MLRRLVRWFVIGVVLVGFVATGAAAQAPEGQIPSLSDVVHDLSVHEQIAILRIFGDHAVAEPEQFAVWEAAVTLDPSLANRAVDRVPPGVMWRAVTVAPVPDWAAIAGELTLHEQAAARAIFSGSGVVEFPEQWAVAELIAYIDPALFETATFVEPAVITPAVSRISPEAIRWTIARMTVHEQLALRALYGAVGLEPNALQTSLAPYAALVGEVTPAPAPLPAPVVIHRALSAMTSHERLALLVMFQAGHARDLPEIAIAAPYVTALGVDTAPATVLESALAGLTAQEKLAILATCEGNPEAPPWADDLLVTILRIKAR